MVGWGEVKLTLPNLLRVKIPFCFRGFSHVFAIANQLHGGFCDVNTFFNVNINVGINDYSFKYIF